MLTLVEARTIQGTLLSLPLADQSSGITVQNIDGLDPVKATIVSSSFTSLDGAQYQSSRRDIRNITMTLGLNPPDYVATSVSSLRSQLYGFFMPGSVVSLRFYVSDDLYLDIMGRVESFTAPLFSNEPTADLSILCMDPDFVDPNTVSLSGSSVATSAETHVVYSGTTNTGFTFTFDVNRAVSEFTIYCRAPDDTISILDFSASLVADDVVVIDTVRGERSVTLTRAGVVSSLLYGMASQSSWVGLMPGDNYIRVYAVGAAVPYTIDYSNRYGGL